MLSKKELLEGPEYLLTGYQHEIFQQLTAYMEMHNLQQKDIAKALGVSNAYISQILNGNFNFTLKKLIELGLIMGKVPHLEFLNTDEFWKRNKLHESQPKGKVISISTRKSK
jgi:transcriptional regulator with XRE-family HTH domain